MSQTKSMGCGGVLLLGFLFLLIIGFLSKQDAPDVPQTNSVPDNTIRQPDIQKPTNTDLPTNRLSPVEWASQIAGEFVSGRTNQLSRTEQVEMDDQMRWNYVDAIGAVKSKLKDPADATFSEIGVNEDAICGPYGYHQWVCSGWVDAFNSFGAKERINWGVCLFRSDTVSRIDYMQIGDSIYGQMPPKIPFPMTPEQIEAAKKNAIALKAAVEQKKKAGADAALKFNQAAADKGDAYGLLRMGERYRDGDGVDKDIAKAKDYFQKSAAAGNADAALALKKLLAPNP